MCFRNCKTLSVFERKIPLTFSLESFVTILDMSLISRSCKNDHIIFNVGTPSLEARNIRKLETAVT
jgi:hypothetical protein